MKIGGRQVGPGHPLFVIAEIGLNHGGSTAEALALAAAAADAGASAVKLQTLRADSLVAPHCPPPAHVAHASLRDFFRGFELGEPAHAAVRDAARARGLAFLSTPFDETAVDMLMRLGADALKIASGDITHLRLIARAAATGLPLIISTGMSELPEIAAALACAREAGATNIALLHCVSSYPTAAAEQNLRAIATLARTFQAPVGLSDHGTDPQAPSLAVALGACIYERHIVTGAGSGAIDEPVSATPAALAGAIASAEQARIALGHGRKMPMAGETPNRVPSRRALYAARDLPAGTVIRDTDLTALRPAAGLGAERWRDLVGRRLGRDMRAGEAFVDADVATGESADAA